VCLARCALRLLLKTPHRGISGSGGSKTAASAARNR